MKFLIVDDSQAMQTIVRRQLEKAGYHGVEFKTAYDGEEALDTIRNWEPDLVISDWHMPQMTGIELLKEIQAQMLNINVGLVTTETSSARVSEALEAGALFVIHKPFETSELDAAILPILQSSDKSEAVLKKRSSHLAQANKPQTGQINLPQISEIEAVLNGVLINPVGLDTCEYEGINYDYLPYILALFADEKTAIIKAVCILDGRAAAIIGGGFSGEKEKTIQTMIKNHTLPDELLSYNKRLINLICTQFSNAGTNKLKVKSVNLIPKPFERLEKIAESSSATRIDFTVKGLGSLSGHGILMTVAE